MPFTQTCSSPLCTCSFCSSQDKQPLLEWLAANYKKFGCNLEFITNKSDVGSQFCRGFGGIGGILRYQVGLASVQYGARGMGQPFLQGFRWHLQHSAMPAEPGFW